MKPKVIVMAGYGINSEEETKFVFEKAGATAEIVHINDLIGGLKKLKQYQILAFPGGFAHGDDTGSGNAYANKMRNNVWEQVRKFINDGNLAIGICNGCQIMANLGLIPGFDGIYGDRLIALRHNASARLECRWVNIKATSEKCVWTRDIDIMRCPIAHGEGNFYMEKKVLDRLNKQDQVVFRYVHEDGSRAKGEFPCNPNGAIEDIAAVSDETGRVLAIMPHPERNWNFYNQDNWTLLREKAARTGGKLPAEGQGMKLFRNAVRYFK